MILEWDEKYTWRLYNKIKIIYIVFHFHSTIHIILTVYILITCAQIYIIILKRTYKFTNNKG